MMLPIANAVLQQLQDTEAQANAQEFLAAAEDNQAFELEDKETKKEVKPQETSTQPGNTVCEYKCQLDV